MAMHHKTRFVTVLFLLLLFIDIESGLAQVMSFHTQTAMSIGFEERAVRSFFRAVNKSGLRTGRRTVKDPLDRNVTILATPIVVPFAVTRRLIPILIVPSMRKQLTTTENGVKQEIRNTGISDVTLNLKYAFWQRDRLNQTTRLAAFAAVKFPTGSTDETDASGKPLPAGLQLGTGSWDFPFGLAFTRSSGRFGLNAALFYRINTEHEAIDFGNQFKSDLAFGYRLYPAQYETYREKVVNLYLEINSTVTGKNQINGETDSSSGGHTIFLSPGLQWVLRQNLLIEASLQLPVFEDLNGTQLENDFVFSAGMRYLLPF